MSDTSVDGMPGTEPCTNATQQGRSGDALADFQADESLKTWLHWAETPVHAAEPQGAFFAHTSNYVVDDQSRESVFQTPIDIPALDNTRAEPTSETEYNYSFDFPRELPQLPQPAIAPQRPSLLLRCSASIKRCFSRNNTVGNNEAPEAVDGPAVGSLRRSKFRPMRSASEREQQLAEKSKKLLVLLEPFECDANLSPASVLSLENSFMTKHTLEPESMDPTQDDSLETCCNVSFVSESNPKDVDAVVVERPLILDTKREHEPTPELFSLPNKAPPTSKDHEMSRSGANGGSIYVCPICWESRCAPELVIVGECAHSFCYYCVQEWVMKSSKCPYCRQKIDGKPLKSRIQKAKIATAASKLVHKSCSAVDQKKEDFRKYLEKNGIIDALTKVLVGLYEEPEKPESPIEFIKQFLGGPGDVDLEALKHENEELKKRVDELQARVEELTNPQEVMADWFALERDIRAMLKQPEWDDGSIGPVLVRLAWHSSGTYSKKDGTGGSDGATMRHAPESTDGANAGLEKARAMLEPLKKKYPAVSRGDLWTLAGVVAIEAMGGPRSPWYPGRTDKEKPKAAEVPPNGRLPDASQGAPHIRDVFYRMGFNDRDIVALSGAHSLGRCHTDRSGYSGPWTNTPTRFSNQYFKLLVKEKWTKKKWDGPEQYEDPSGELMMLPSDLALIWDPKFKVVVEEYAEDKDTFFKDFSTAFGKLLELGVRRSSAKL
ncbi:hypothetical protein HDU77_010179 [Chytriomyces hyalinus]|nr:hypothetical protein HDU77_010179 [Chytriomyces hyalinus]